MYSFGWRFGGLKKLGLNWASKVNLALFVSLPEPNLDTYLHVAIEEWANLAGSKA